MHRLLIFCALLFILPAHAAEWQFSATDDAGKIRAWLWIPPTCTKVRGLVLGNQVILENLALEDAQIRHAAADENLAIVLCDGGLGQFDFSAGADQKLTQLLTKLAQVSGYDEIATAPLLPIGHSGGAIFAWNVAYWQPQRVFGIVGLHTVPLLAPSFAPKASASGIPSLTVTGQYEMWGNAAQTLDHHWKWVRGVALYMRALPGENLASELVQPGAGHFSWPPELAAHVALFIRKAAHYRIGDDGKLKHLDVKSGWLTDSTLMTPSRFAPAPYQQFKGDPTLAFWHMDEELARTTENFTRGSWGKARQMITLTHKGQPLLADWLEEIPCEPIGDGLTFKVGAQFLTETPAKNADGGLPLGRAKSSDFRFQLIGGWGGGGEQIAPDTFRIRFSHFGLQRAGTLMLTASHPGDQKYAPTEIAGSIKFSAQNKTGAAQSITFEPPQTLDAGAKTLDLQATATSGLPVEYFVSHGPAEVVGHQLRLTTLPPRTKFPVEISVTSYQWGKLNEVQSAPLVERIIRIEKLSGARVTLRDFMDAPPPQERVYKKVGDSELKLYFFAPPDKTPMQRPAMVWIHGGAWVAGDASVFFPHARYFATRGAVAFSINYRLTKIGGPQVSDCLTDCKSAIRYIRSHAAELGIDPNRITVLGDSAGGHLAAALGTIFGFDDPHDDLTISAMPNAMVLFNPIVDMTEGDWVYHAARGANPKDDKPPISEAMLGVARSLSPLFAVRAGQPPTLLMHGLDDHVVEAEQARRFADAMKEAGNRCDLILLEKTRHAFAIANYTAPESTVVGAIRAADNFLISLGYLQGAPTLEVAALERLK